MKIDAQRQLIIEETDLPALVSWYRSAVDEQRQRTASIYLKGERILRAQGDEQQADVLRDARAALLEVAA